MGYVKPYSRNQYTNRLEAKNQFKLFVNWVHFVRKFGTNLCKESLEKEFGREFEMNFEREFEKDSMGPIRLKCEFVGPIYV